MATDYTTLITSEHNTKPKFMALVAALTGAIGDITDTIQGFPEDFDLDNAVGAQLDVIGLWVGQSRIIPNLITISYFGFEDTPDSGTFGELSNPSIGSPWFSLGDPTSGNGTSLNDPAYRTLIRARIVRNQYDGTLGQLEQALEDVFNVPCIVNDPGTMSINIIVNGQVTALEQTLLNNVDILPRPAGVSIGSITFSTALQGAAKSASTAGATISGG